MEDYTRENIQATFDKLAALSDKELDDQIDEATTLLFEELRIYVEHMTCNVDINFSHLVYEGRMDWQRKNFNYLCFERMRRYAKKRREECVNGQ